MTGADCLLRSLAESCLMNSSTSGMRFVSALDRVPEVRGVLCLFERVCSGVRLTVRVLPVTFEGASNFREDAVEALFAPRCEKCGHLRDSR